MLDQLKPLLGKLALFSQERMGFKHPPKLFLRNDSTNSQQALGKTAFYNPEEQSVTLFVHGRHPKDILRSFAHELVHHTQNLRGDLTSEKMGEMGSNYAQDNEHLRNMEKEAYLDGNMCFRDWEDTVEDKDLILIKLAESKFLKENKTMTTKITKEFLKDTIRNVLMERMSDEDFVAYAQRNKYARDTQAYRNAVARIQKKKEMAAAKAAQPSKLQQGIASYFKDAPVMRSTDAGTAEPDDEEMIAKKPEKKDNKFMSGLRSWASSFVKEADESTLREVFGDLINEAELEEAPIKVPNKPDEPKTEKEYQAKDEEELKDMLKKEKEDSAKELAANISEGGCSSSHAPGKRCEKCGYMEEVNDLEEGKECPHCDGDAPKSECICGKVEEAAKPDYIDIDGDGDKEEPMKKAAEDKKLKKETIQTPEQENALYENRFAPRNTRLFEKLVKDWTK